MVHALSKRWAMAAVLWSDSAAAKVKVIHDPFVASEPRSGESPVEARLDVTIIFL